MPNNLIFLAGKKAYSLIKDNGLKPDMVKVIAGAAGGPKWLILNHLDRALFTHWLKDRSNPLFLIGSSIAAWRFAAVSQSDPRAAIDKFQSAYLGQTYSDKPTPAEISRETSRVRDLFLDQTAIQQILDHPSLRLNFMAVRSRGLNRFENKFLLGAGLAGTALLNIVSRRFLRYFFERTLFYHPETAPPFFNTTDFPLKTVPLDKDNLAPALLASGSIPLIMSGVNGIKGAVPGSYRDGGVIDYHMDIPFLKETDEKIVLFPHYSRRIIPGWLDKKLTWRKPHPSNMDPVLQVAPSESFIESLPLQKIPDRNDFWLFAGKEQERIDYWEAVIKKSELLGAEFLDAVESGKIKNLVQPMTN